MTVLAGLAALPLLYWLLTTPARVEEWASDDGQAHVTFTASRSRVIFPNQCVDLAWAAEGIQTIQFNGEGTVGHRTQTVCGSSAYRLRFTLPDGSAHESVIRVQQLYRQTPAAALLVVAVMGGVLAIYHLVSLPAALVVFTGILIAPILSGWVYNADPSTDYSIHLQFAEEVMAGTRQWPPHFLYHGLLVALSPLVSLQTASMLILIAATIAAVLGVYALIDADTRRTLGLVVLVALPLLVIAAPVQLGQPVRIMSAYILLNPQHNPTMTLLKPFAMWIVVGLALLLAKPIQPRWRVVATIAILTVLATLAKPSFTLMLLPVGGLLFLLLPARRWDMLASVLLPAVLILAGQYLYLYGSQQATMYTEPARIAFAPLELYRNYWTVTPIEWALQTFASCLFPLAVLALYWRDAYRDPLLRMVWLMFLGGVALALLFVEFPAVRAGNMVWSERIGLFVLFGVTLAFLLRRTSRDWRMYAGLLVFGLHALTGWMALF